MFGVIYFVVLRAWWWIRLRSEATSDSIYEQLRSPLNTAFLFFGYICFRSAPRSHRYRFIFCGLLLCNNIIFLFGRIREISGLIPSDAVSCCSSECPPLSAAVSGNLLETPSAAVLLEHSLSARLMGSYANSNLWLLNVSRWGGCLYYHTLGIIVGWFICTTVMIFDIKFKLGDSYDIKEQQWGMTVGIFFTSLAIINNQVSRPLVQREAPQRSFVCSMDYA